MLTDACWSPTRPSLFFTCRTDGWIEAWDIIENQKTPVMTHKTQDGPAHCLAAHSEGFLMCVGGNYMYMQQENTQQKFHECRRQGGCFFDSDVQQPGRGDQGWEGDSVHHAGEGDQEGEDIVSSQQGGKA